MEILLSEKFVKKAIVKWLFKNGWGTNLEIGELRDPGVDIRVRNNKYSRYFLIETKGEGSKLSNSRRSQRETHFVYGVGQIITRMKTGNSRYYYGLGVPESIARIAIRRLPWQVAKKLLIYIFSVNAKGKVNVHSWKDLKASQV
jgi:hypothetical protein